MKTLLEKLRTLNKFFRRTSVVDFQQAAETLAILVNAKVYIVDTDDKILGCSASGDGAGDEAEKLPEKYDALFHTGGTITDVLIGDEVCSKIAMYAGRTDIGSIVAIRPQTQPDKLTDEEIILLENAALVISMEEYYQKKEQAEAKKADREKVKNALELLSYSELKAVVNVFRELREPEGIIVASKIADKEGLTRSVIVNAIRKLQSATLIQSRSLGMKGTYFKISSKEFFHVIDAIAKERNL